MAKKLIYVLEDDPDILQLIELLLKKQGYAVSCFATVAAFNLQIVVALPDLCIFDVNLPDGNGLDVSRSLSSILSTAHLPILLMSANLFAKTQYQEAGAQSFISKPFSIDAFLDAVKELA